MRYVSGIRRLLPAPAGDGLGGDLGVDALVAGYEPPDRSLSWLRVNFVSSADGAVAVAGRSEPLSGEADKRVFGLLRMLCDVLLVGAGTLRDESYGPLTLDPYRRDWRRRHGLAERPRLAVVSDRLALDPTHPALADAPVRPIVFTHARAPVSRRSELASVAEIIVTGDTEVDLAAVRQALTERGATQVLSEGGPRLFGSLLAAGEVDELCLTVSPLLVGAGTGRIVRGPTSPPRSMALRQVLEADGCLLLRYTRSP